MVIKLFENEAREQKVTTDIVSWTIEFSAENMTPQRPYLAYGHHPNTAIHIDCGIYAALMPLLLIKGYTLSALHPAQAHRFRVTAAHIIWTQQLDFSVESHIQQSTNDVSAGEHPAQLTYLDTQTTAPPKPVTVSVRTAIPLDIRDKATEHTFVAESTIPGAGYGLFASRVFDDQTDGPEHVG